jgi:hypothetical protein
MILFSVLLEGTPLSLWEEHLGPTGGNTCSLWVVKKDFVFRIAPTPARAFMAIAPQKSSAFKTPYRICHMRTAYARDRCDPSLARASHAIAVGVSRDANEDPEILRAQAKAGGAHRDAGEPRGHRGDTAAMLVAFTRP